MKAFFSIINHQRQIYDISADFTNILPFFFKNPYLLRYKNIKKKIKLVFDSYVLILKNLER